MPTDADTEHAAGRPTDDDAAADERRHGALRRIRALLDQAESTGFPEEAEAFLAKATELMARHRVTEAMLDATGRGRRGDDVVEHHVELGRGPYVNARLVLLAVCGRACDCVVLQHTGFEGKTALLIGHRHDVARVELLYTSLSLQASSALTREVVPRGQHATTFRRSFLFAWAERVGHRLEEANRRAEAEADTAAEGVAPGPAGRPGVALVLAERRGVVDDFVRQAHPRVGAGRAPGGRLSQAGRRAGAAAAEGADIGHRGLGDGPRALSA